MSTQGFGVSGEDLVRADSRKTRPGLFNSAWFDVALTVLVTVLLGSIVATCVALASDRFLSRTVSGIIGDYGEYDLILHVRQELAPAAERQISDVLARRFSGSRLKKGITLAGRTNFLLSVGLRWRNRQGFESIFRAFSDLPGGAGRTTMVEPRVTLSEVNPGVRLGLMDKIERLPQVAFAFRDGGGITVVLRSAAGVEEAKARIQALLTPQRIIEARFPIGLDAGDEVALGRTVAAAINGRFGPGAARDVTAAAARDDTRDLADTLIQMRSFLEGYATRVEISTHDRLVLRRGDTVTLRHGRAVLTARVEDASAAGAGTGTGGSGKASAIVTGGSLPEKSSSWTWEVTAKRGDGTPGTQRIGTATAWSEKNELAAAMRESILLLENLDALSKSGLEAAGRLLQALDSRDELLSRLVSARRLLERADSMLAASWNAPGSGTFGDGAVQDGTARDGTAPVDIQAAVKALDGAMRVLESVDSALAGLSSFAAQTARTGELARNVGSLLDRASASAGRSGTDAGPGVEAPAPGADEAVAGVRALIGSVEERAVSGARQLDIVMPGLGEDLRKLEAWRATASSLIQGLEAVTSTLADPVGSRAKIARLMESTDAAIDVLRSSDAYSARRTLAAVSEDLSAVQETDLESIADQLAYVEDSLPDLDDGKVGRTIALVDRYLGGEVIPGDRVQTVVDGSLPLATVYRLVREELGPQRAAVFATPVATVDPGIRSELFRVLREARATVGLLVCVVITLLSLVLDHSTVAAYLAWVRRNAVTSRRSRCGRRGAAAPGLAAVVYSCLAGSATLGGLLLLSRTRPPFGGWYLGPWLGAALGLAVGSMCERLSPLDTDEAVAGRAVGLSFAQILREIVIPGGRPGAGALLNRWRRAFKGTAAAGCSGARAGKRVDAGTPAL